MIPILVDTKTFAGMQESMNMGFLQAIRNERVGGQGLHGKRGNVRNPKSSHRADFTCFVERSNLFGNKQEKNVETSLRYTHQYSTKVTGLGHTVGSHGSLPVRLKREKMGEGEGGFVAKMCRSGNLTRLSE